MIIFNSDRLIHLRKQRNIDQDTLSKETKINASVICRLEKGKTKFPTFETVEALARFFKVNMETFKKEIKC